ncbi:MAG TPA: hypothetical protein VFD33_06575 [Bacillota bacterium]|nr:hypothetical protein [Bacillota bacterium]
MEYICEASEDEMVLLFLQTEIKSTRFRGRILKAIKQLNTQESIITEPNLDSAEENEMRKRILSIFRGYGRNAEIFEGLPEDIRWVWVNLTRGELEMVRYIEYSYWNELSAGSRLAKDAAVNIRKGMEIFGVKNDGFIAGSKYLVEGGSFPPMIFLTDNDNKHLVALEGHLRLTAYMLEPDFIPDKLRTMIGYVARGEFIRWACID